MVNCINKLSSEVYYIENLISLLNQTQNRTLLLNFMNQISHIHQIGLGTASIGRPQYINIWQEKKEKFNFSVFRQKAFDVLDKAYDNGIRYFDTAPGYGKAEEWLLEWVKDKINEDIEIATKWGYTYTANFDPEASQHEIKEHSLAKLNEQWIQSEKLLPNLTTYQIHSATFETGVLNNKLILNRLAELKREHGLLIGLTTSGANQNEVIKNAVEIEIDGIPLFETFQITYNMLDQSLSDLSDRLKNENKRIIIKEALANGRLFPNKNYPHYKTLYSALENLAEKYQVGIDAIALRFCIDSVDPYMVLSGAANIDHVLENMKANEIKLSEEDLNTLCQFRIPSKSYWQERKQLSWS